MKKLNLLLIAAISSGLVSSAAISAEPQPAAVPAAQAPAKEKMICRRDKEIGSLVATKKTCHTKSQWQYIDDTNQTFANKLVDDSRSKSGGN